MSNNPLRQSAAWQSLAAHKKEIDAKRIEYLFHEGEEREENFTASEGPLRFDYSRTKMNDETITLLSALAEECDLNGWREKMFSGAVINNSENRPVLHTALRGSADDSVEFNGKNINACITDSLAQIKKFTKTLHDERRFTHIVNIGVGGSDTGPRLVCESLKKYQRDDIQVHFLATIDPAEAHEVFQQLDAAKTLFIVASKSFGTQETLTNFELARNWMVTQGHAQDWEEHFVAVTSRADRAQEKGFQSERIFHMGEWVGGRFSLWSSIGLIIPLAFGFENFEALLEGAHKADMHFITRPMHENIPTLMGMIGIWHRNFFDFQNQCILPYNHNLRTLPRYIQQLDMESNGKRVDRDGKEIAGYDSSPFVFGEVGTNAQHAFFQMLHQGTNICPCEFVVTQKALYDSCAPDNHTLLLSNVYGQMKALMVGRTNTAEPHRNFPGDRPSTLLMLDDLTPEALGIMLAFYEHKTFVQGVIWGINSFDQWGVELGKELALETLQSL